MPKYLSIIPAALALYCAYVTASAVDAWNGEADFFALSEEQIANAQEFGEASWGTKTFMVAIPTVFGVANGVAAYRIVRS